MRLSFDVTVLLLASILVMSGLGDSRGLKAGDTITVTPDKTGAGDTSFGVPIPSAKADTDTGEEDVPEKEEWPELVGMDAEAAKSQIEKEVPGVKVLIVASGSAVTLDFRTDRVRVFVDNNRVVVKPPKLG